MAHRYVAGDAHRCGESHRLREACRERCAACLRVRCPTSQRLLYLVPASLTLSVTVETASNLSRSTRVPYPHLSRSAKDQPVATHNSESDSALPHVTLPTQTRHNQLTQAERHRKNSTSSRTVTHTRHPDTAHTRIHNTRARKSQKCEKRAPDSRDTNIRTQSLHDASYRDSGQRAPARPG